MADSGLYVYGLVAAGALARAPELPGVDGTHAVECLTERDICALVSRVSLEQFDEQPLREHLADMAWVEQTARRHQQVLEAVLEQCTPIPMRLCTVYGDEEGLREMLDRESDDLTAALSDLSGKLEWGVQAFAGPRPESERRSAPTAGQSVATGTDYLQSRLAARNSGEQSDAELERHCDRLYAELGAIAEACRLGVPQRPDISGHEAPMILNAFYLVANERRERFCSHIAEIRGELGAQGIELRLTGPWAPYNFVAAVVGGER
jgi:hypothetical protein